MKKTHAEIRPHPPRRPVTCGCAGLLALCLWCVPPLFAQNPRVWKAPPEADTLQNPYAVTEAFIQSGQQTYDVLCWTCHGERGEGDGPAGTGTETPPADFTQDAVQAQSDGALFWKLTTGNPPMAAYEKVLSEKERWELVAYIRQLARRAGEE